MKINLKVWWTLVSVAITLGLIGVYLLATGEWPLDLMIAKGCILWSGFWLIVLAYILVRNTDGKVRSKNLSTFLLIVLLVVWVALAPYMISVGADHGAFKVLYYDGVIPAVEITGRLPCHFGYGIVYIRGGFGVDYNPFNYYPLRIWCPEP